jgi:hypothetical protein
LNIGGILHDRSGAYVVDTPKDTNAMLHFLTFIPQLAYKNYIFFFRYGPGVLASAQAISEPACLRGDGLGHTRDLPRGRRLEAR